MPNETEGRIPLADLLVFHQLTRSLTSSFDLDTILRTILEQMEKMVEAEFWALLMLDESTKDLYYAIAAGEEQETLRGLRVKRGEGVAGWVLEHGETLLVPQMEGDPRAAQSATPGISSVRSVIAMPLRGRTGIQGVIEILNPRAEMSDYSIAFLHILADHAAIAIENAQDMARIQQLTITDDTTGLFNVRHLYDVLHRELKHSTKHKQPLSLAFWDLDHFKLVNDAHGHMIGSELLTRAGRRLQKLCRAQDSAYRYGGDEFVILMPRTPAAQALELTKGMHAALMETPFGMKSGLSIQVCASVGLSASPADGTHMHEIIGTADARMYAVKRHGRGHVRAS